MNRAGMISGVILAPQTKRRRTMTEKLLELLKTIENLDTDELLKVKLWVELNLQNRKDSK